MIEAPGPSIGLWKAGSGKRQLSKNTRLVHSTLLHMSQVNIRWIGVRKDLRHFYIITMKCITSLGTNINCEFKL